MTNLDFKKINNIHFIGIGGIMMSAIARYFLAMAKNISGSDRDKTALLDELASVGAKISIGHRRANITPAIDLIICTPAVSSDNPEIQAGRALHLPIYTVYQIIGQLSSHMFTTAVSGMHGKSTITSLIGLIAAQAKLDPTVFVGTRVKEWHGNFRSGQSNLLITEACEYRDNFLSLTPDILVINNIEPEHLDYFKNLKNIKQSFAKLVKRIKLGGALVVNCDDKNVARLAKNFAGRVVSYGIRNKADFWAQNISVNKRGETEFILASVSTKKIKIALKIPGQFNLYNVLAALAATSALGVKIAVAQKTVANFNGVWRRFEYRGKKHGLEVFDDYAHHPTEIRATLIAAREKFRGKKMLVVFQPHLYSRTRDFLSDFAESLSLADDLIVTHIYAAREKNPRNISGQDIVAMMNKKKPGKTQARYIASFDKIIQMILNNKNQYDILLTMGAGDVNKIGESILQ